MTPEFRQGETVRDVVLPCCECGGDSDAYASFDDGAWLCRACSDADKAKGAAMTSGLDLTEEALERNAREVVPVLEGITEGLRAGLSEIDESLSHLEAAVAEPAAELAGDPGERVRADLRQLARDVSLSTERHEVMRHAAQYTHERLQVARRAMVEMAAEIHRGHAGSHPSNHTWRECVSETCERSRRRMFDVEGIAEIGGSK